jgi:hypothetical protein
VLDHALPTVNANSGDDRDDDKGRNGMSVTRKPIAIGLGLAAACAAATVAMLAPTAGAQEPEGQKGGKAGMRQLQGVNFIGNCRFSHRAVDDPIVAPGKPGASHDHSFVGNRTTNAWSTVDTLLAGSTTCRRSGETAAYWMPTLYVDGNAVAPLSSTIYYRRKTREPVSAPPAGLKIIAGDASATSPQSRGITFWNCGVEGGVPASSTPPACPSGRGKELRLHVTFPACWNGVSLDSPNHKQHMAYQMNGRCPAAYPVELPQISLIYRYPVSGAHDIALASGGVYSAHADFFNAWNQDTLQGLVDSCLNRLRHCGQGS